MRKCIITLILLTSILAGGCSVNQEFIKAVDGYTKVILPEYKNYITNDPYLNERTKRIRMQTAEKFQELIDEAKGE